MDNTIDFFWIDYAPPKSGGKVACRFFFPRINDYIIGRIFSSGTFYEIDLLEHMFRCLPHRGVYIDVGANIGNHTIFFSKFLAGTVFSIEPHPTNYDLLEYTVDKNNLNNVVCVRAAAGDKAQQVWLSLPEGFEGNSGSFRVINANTADKLVPVTMQTLDHLFCRSGLNGQQVTAIKIDVEGYEVQVLCGAIQILQRNNPHVFVECKSDRELEAVSQTLLPLGYRIIGRWCATPTYHFAPWGLFRHLSWRAHRKGRHLLRNLGLI